MGAISGLIFFTLFSGCICALTPEQLVQIDSVVNDLFIPANHVTGMSLSIVQNGETVLSKGYRKRDIENNLDAQNDTLFSIGSISKSLIATLVVKTLNEKYPTYGEAILDFPIAQLTPGFNHFNFTFSDRFRAEQTSFRDLLSHRTCLFDEGMDLIFGTLPTDQESRYRSRYQKQICGHRAGFQYNNALYALAGDLIASFESITLERMVRDFMLELGMEHSTTIDISASYEDLPNMSQAYYRKDGQIGKFNRTLLRRVDKALGAGGILSTSNDMAKYASFHLNKGKVGEKQVVSEEALSWLYKPAIPLEAIVGKQSDNDKPVIEEYSYGLGFFLSLYDGYSLIQHGGYWPPYHSALLLFPAKNVGVFLVTNGPGRLIEVSHLNAGAAVYDIVTGAQKLRLSQTPRPSRPLFSEGLDDILGDMKNLGSTQKINSVLDDKEKMSRIEFEDVIGLYGDDSSGDLTISLDADDNSFLEINIAGDYGIGRLLPVNGSETKFLVDWKTDFLHHFYTYPPEALPMPTIYVEFRVNSLYFVVENMVNILYIRNATMETFPAIPWDPISCGPY